MPDPVPQVVSKPEAGSYDLGRPKRWTGSVEQDFTRRARDQPVAMPRAGHPMPFAPNLTIEQDMRERERHERVETARHLAEDG